MGTVGAPKRSNPPTLKTSARPASRSGYVLTRSCPAYGMAETTVAVSFSECGAGLLVDQIDADLLALLHRAVPATKGKTRRLATLGRPLSGLQALSGHAM